MISPKLTAEQQHQKNLELLKKLRPMDDAFMREMFRGDLKFTEDVLKIITDKQDLIVTSEETQYDMEHLLGARSIALDVLATDSHGRKYNLEVQRNDSGAAPKRARYHSSALDVEFLQKNKKFEELPITYVIFITEHDVLKENRPIYSFGRVDLLTGKPFGDDEYIIFVNGEYNDENDNSDLAKLIHDFRCNNADDMYLGFMADRTRYYKETDKGVNHMCKLWEDSLNERIEEEKYEIVMKMLQGGKLTLEEISDYSNLPIETVKELAEQLKPA